MSLVGVTLEVVDVDKADSSIFCLQEKNSEGSSLLAPLQRLPPSSRHTRQASVSIFGFIVLISREEAGERWLNELMVIGFWRRFDALL